MQTIAEAKEAAGLPDGLHSAEGVRFLAEAAGFQGGELPPTVILSQGFAEVTGFFRESKGRGYWMTTLNGCSCPDFKYRKAGTGKLCKHQSKLIAVVQQREFDEAYATYQKAKETYQPEPLPELPTGVVRMTSAEMEARRARINARNAKIREDRAKDPTFSTSKGFNCPGEAVAPV
jgi:hypothetical protein